MSFPVFIPDQLDPVEISNRVAPYEEPLEPDKMAWIISIWSDPKHSRYKAKWFFPNTPGSAYMQSMFRDYNIYIDHLLTHDILETTGSFTEAFPRSFYFVRFAVEEDYRLKPYYIENPFLVRKLWRQLNSYNQSVEKSHGFITRWFNDNLTIDYDRAVNMLRESAPEDAGYDDHVWAVERIQHQNYFFSVSAKVGRFFSPITSMKKDLRKFLRYNEKKIKSFDLKNSVPFLSTFFLLPEFYQKKQEGVPNIKDLGSLFIRRINAIHPSLIKYMKKEWPKLAENDDVKRYIEVCRNGGFYEIFEERLRVEFNKTYDIRKELKVDVLSALFSRETPTGRVYRWFPAKWVFKREFPTVFELFRYIKQDSTEEKKKLLSHLFMKYESVFIVDTIAKGFVNKYRNIPVWTIHDNIATTEDHFDKLLEFYKEKCLEYLGIIPLYEIENWFE